MASRAGAAPLPSSPALLLLLLAAATAAAAGIGGARELQVGRTLPLSPREEYVEERRPDAVAGATAGVAAVREDFLVNRRREVEPLTLRDWLREEPRRRRMPGGSPFEKLSIRDRRQSAADRISYAESREMRFAAAPYAMSKGVSEYSRQIAVSPSAHESSQEAYRRNVKITSRPEVHRSARQSIGLDAECKTIPLQERRQVTTPVGTYHGRRRETARDASPRENVSKGSRRTVDSFASYDNYKRFLRSASTSAEKINVIEDHRRAAATGKYIEDRRRMAAKNIILRKHGIALTDAESEIFPGNSRRGTGSAGLTIPNQDFYGNRRRAVDLSVSFGGHRETRNPEVVRADEAELSRRDAAVHEDLRSAPVAVARPPTPRTGHRTPLVPRAASAAHKFPRFISHSHCPYSQGGMCVVSQNELRSKPNEWRR